MEMEDAVMPRPLRKAGFLWVNAQTLPDRLRQYPHLLVLLQSDASRHPEVADSWVIVPQLLAQFPAGAVTPTVASVADSEALARQYRILKFPSLLFFHHQRLTGSLSGLLPWQDYLQAMSRYLVAGQREQAIAVVQDLT